MGGSSLCRCQCPRESVEKCHPSLAVKGYNQPGYHDANESFFGDGAPVKVKWLKTSMCVAL